MEFGALLSYFTVHLHLSSYTTDTVKVIKGYGRRDFSLIYLSRYSSNLYIYKTEAEQYPS